MTSNVSSFFEDILEESLNNVGNIFQNEQVFSSDFVPQNFPNRSQQLKEMIRYFRGFFNDQNSQKNSFYSQTILLQGDIGSGKTSVAKRFGLEFETLAKKRYPDLNVKYRHLNCRRNKTVYTLLVHLLQSLIPYFPNRGFSPAELLRLLETHLIETNSYLMLALDEIDMLIHDREFHTLLYSLTRLNDELLVSESSSGQKRISLILITRDKYLLNLLDQSARSSIAKNIINFPKYNSFQIKEILIERIIEGFHPEIINEEPLIIISEIASKLGDARFAIELLWRSGKNAEADKSIRILPNHIRMAQNSVYSISEEILNDLSIEHSLFLFTIASWFSENPKQEFMKIAEVRKYLPIYAERFGIKKVGKGNTSMWLYMKFLSSWGLIKTQIVSSGHRGRKTLISLALPPDLIINGLVNDLILKKKSFSL